MSRRLLLCALLLVLTACSSSGDDASAPTIAAIPPPISTTAPAVATESTDSGAQSESETEAAPEVTEAPSEVEVAAESEETPEREEPQDEEPELTATPACGVVIEVLFDEGAPRDRMSISNGSTAAIDITKVTFDLSTSFGRIIFDTLDGGAGVEVFQDFRVESGSAELTKDPTANDGADSLVLEFDRFATGDDFTFSIDVDDQLVDSALGQIQVTGAEIEGASVSFEIAQGDAIAATFGADSAASANSGC